jgi:hypothetical protein
MKKIRYRFKVILWKRDVRRKYENLEQEQEDMINEFNEQSSNGFVSTRKLVNNNASVMLLE